MKHFKVLISILNWNNWLSTVETINSVLLSDYKHFEIIILDNNSQDDSVEQLKKKIPGIQVWGLKKNIGYAGAHKKAADYAINNNFDLLWILNNDVKVFQFTLSEFINAHSRNDNSLLGSVSLKEDGKTIQIGSGSELINNQVDLSIPYNQYGGKNYFETIMKERPVSDLEGASFIIPIEIIKKYGFLDTRFFLYGEESDYCYRLRNRFNIQSVIVPDARVIHLASETFRLSPRLTFVKAYYNTRNSHLLHYKYFKGNKLQGNGKILHFFKFFLRHYIVVKSKDKNPDYWVRYYNKLGAFHALLRFKGKYLEPSKFLTTNKSIK
ncbi:MAG: glycosyltransferase family 2 protein [Ferruginibacter sp.]|nr:glycosyltransferase family 2 protein [Ferruginibacter sp.]